MFIEINPDQLDSIVVGALTTQVLCVASDVTKLSARKKLKPYEKTDLKDGKKILEHLKATVAYYSVPK
tara:strand:+ start:270 stop:473 length:204 start_codon:yes stop_codon:yes gene_type:complete